MIITDIIRSKLSGVITITVLWGAFQKVEASLAA